VRATALFAHCFTCGKNSRAAVHISRTLAAQGIATLRFDFTGLGSSEGDFANSSFVTNVQDLVAASDFLRDHHQAPTLLIGHSLGGAAVLAAAGDVPECRGVVTIGAPADPAHVTHLLGDSIADIREKGVADLTLAGRPFRIGRRFLDDLESNCQPSAIAALNRDLLVMHAPTDEIVGVDNARRIFESAKHPKSFVSLDRADHLLTNPTASQQAAKLIAAWAARLS
jgi:putative redox protein